MGKEHGADLHEFILNADKESIFMRADARGYPPGSTFTRERVLELWQKGQDLIARRSNAIVIDTSDMSPEVVYQKVTGYLN